MVEINNQRKAFLDMLHDGGELITDVRKPKSWLWRHCGRELFTDYSDHLANLCKPKTQINRRRTLQLLFPLVGCLPQAAWPERLLRKVRTLWHCMQIKERGALPGLMFDIRQAIDRCSNIWASAGRGYSQFEHKADSLIAKIQRSGRNSQRDWCMSRVTAIISALVICIIVCLSWAVNHYRDNAITYKAQREKCQKLKLANAAITACDASAWCCHARCKIHWRS